MAQARFVLMPRAVAAWRLVSPENRELGRAARPAATRDECGEVLGQLIAALPRVRSRVLGPQERTWSWIVEDRRMCLVTAPGTYESPRTAQRAADGFLLQAPTASLPAIEADSPW